MFYVINKLLEAIINGAYIIFRLKDLALPVIIDLHDRGVHAVYVPYFSGRYLKIKLRYAFSRVIKYIHEILDQELAVIIRRMMKIIPAPEIAFKSREFGKHEMMKD